jgi:hypothetical protein
MSQGEKTIGVVITVILCQVISMAAVSPLQQCINRVSSRYKPLKGHATLKQEQQFQAELAKCASPGLPRSQAACIGAVNYDYTLLANWLKKGRITPAQYLQRLRDRDRRSERCTQDAWSAAFVRGDRDRDLVPDKYDRCPETAELAPTDDSGCPVQEATPDQGPSRQDFEQLKKFNVFLGNPSCAGAPVPTVPAVVSFKSVGYPTVSPPKLRSEFRKVVNQPAKCPLVYEARLEEVVPLRLHNSPPPTPESILLLLRPRDATNRSDATAETFVFESLHPRLVVLFHWGATARIRAINGSGSMSAWTQAFPIGRAP